MATTFDQNDYEDITRLLEGDERDLDGLDLEDIEAELARFEQQERERLGLPPAAGQDHWRDPLPSTFTASQRSHTTILVSGLSMAQDIFIQHALRGVGYKVQALDCPDNESLRFGKEYGNRGQCNPTYFTVGNLVKHLVHLRDDEGMTTEEIENNHVFFTAGACGPCRFGTYVTEYRKALRDAGFNNFRVMLFQQTGGLHQATGEDAGLQLNPRFFLALVAAMLTGDAINQLGYRIRPYEVSEGATDAALDACKAEICAALEKGVQHLLPALVRSRKLLDAVEIDRTQVHPRVCLYGEFWAMTTEGDGNYRMQRFLESEGAEVDAPILTNWLLYMLWEARHDTRKRETLRGDDAGKFGLDGVDPRKRKATVWAGEKALRGLFHLFARTLGLKYELCDMDELARISHEHYDNNLRGGEGHLEVAKLIKNVAYNKVTMMLSVKPFGCMPSSAVSDGVQSLITERYPQALFLPVETSGDGAVNVYSRVQMQMFKARQVALKEVEQALADVDLTMDEVRAYLDAHPKMKRPLYRSPHAGSTATVDLIHDVARRMNRGAHLKAKLRGGWQALTASLARD